MIIRYCFLKVGQPKTEDPLLLSDQLQKSKTFAKDVALDMSGRAERYLKFRHERRWTAGKLV
jgi:hypothetical protein